MQSDKGIGTEGILKATDHFLRSFEFDLVSMQCQSQERGEGFKKGEQIKGGRWGVGERCRRISIQMIDINRAPHKTTRSVTRTTPAPRDGSNERTRPE